MPPEWDRREPACWEQLGVVDVSWQGDRRANMRRGPAGAPGWYRGGARFLRSIMRP